MRYSDRTYCGNPDREPLTDSILSQLDAHAEMLAREEQRRIEKAEDVKVYKHCSVDKNGRTPAQRTKIAYNNNRQVRLLQEAIAEQVRRFDRDYLASIVENLKHAPKTTED